MKITLLLNETGMSGGVRIALHQADQLRRRGHEVQIVSLPVPRVDPKTLRRYKQRKLLNDIRDPFGTIRRMLGPKRKISHSHLDLFPPFPHHQLEDYRTVVDADLPEADVLIATWWETALMAAATAPSKGKKVSFFQQYDANFRQPEDKVAAAWNLPAQKIVSSQWLADLASTRFGDESAIVVNNGIDLDLFDAPARGKQPVPTVGLLFSPAAPKGWPTALTVLQTVQKQLPNLRIRTFGMTQPFHMYPLPPGAEFELLPDQTRIREIYSGCDVWFCASTSEGFHLPPHEAMACRTPVVSTRVGGPMDMITDDVNGYLTAVGDETMLTKRLVEVLTMPEERWRAMSDQAYALARVLTWDLAGDRFEAALHGLMARNSAEPVAT